MIRHLLLLVMLFLFSTAICEAAQTEDIENLILRITKEFKGKIPAEWGESVPGVRRRLDTSEKVIALTLDACGSPRGKGADMKLVRFLSENRIPATLFMNARWIDANPSLFRELAADSNFEIANHGMWHKPA